MSSSSVVADRQQSPGGNLRTARDTQLSTSEPFPSIPNENVISETQTGLGGAEQRDASSTSNFAGRIRSASKRFEESSIPKGMWDATASIASSIPSLADIRRGSFGTDGWSAEGQLEERERRSSIAQRRSSQTGEDYSQRPSLGGPRSPGRPRGSGSIPHHGRLPEMIDGEKDEMKVEKSPTSNILQEHTRSVHEDVVNDGNNGDSPSAGQQDSSLTSTSPPGTSKRVTPDRTTPFDNGYHFPPKHTWNESTGIFLKGFWSYTTTWLGFLVVIYGLNVVAWGGMIFLLLCNAAPAMCNPTCDDINSPRRIWIEYDSQILTALFCVTGFGLIPWRFRDFYYLMKYRLRKDQLALRRLAGIHRGWFRLEGSQNLPVLLGPGNVEVDSTNYLENSVPYPLKSISNAPLTGIRSPPTPLWKLDYVIWMFVWNTFLQAVLSGLMWGLNRYNRPSWSTGVFVALACIVAACGGIMIFNEGKKVKGFEGIPISEKDQERLKNDEELGILHFNNIKDKIPKEKKTKPTTRLLGKSQRTEGVLDGNGGAGTELREISL